MRLIRFSFIFFVFSFLSLTSCKNSQESTSKNHKIIVSVAPQKFIIKKIAKDTLEVDVFVPAGASPHSYEPSPQKVLSLANADFWFRIGEGFEKRAIEVIQSHNSTLKVVDLRNAVDLLPLCCCHAHLENDADAHDSHIWLSPKLLIKQAALITSSLIEFYPEFTSLYEENLAQFTEELIALDQEISTILDNSIQNWILVSHPAFAYFCRDYHLNQLSIEVEGKDPTAKQLTLLMEKARQEKIQKVFIQEQYNKKGAMLIAEQLQAEIVVLDPYEENVVENLRKIALAFGQ